MITLLVLVAFGSLLIPKNGEGGNGSGTIPEAQPIPLEYISSMTTSIIDPETVNPYRNQVVGTNSYLTMVQTSSQEFIDIQSEEFVPPRFQSPNTPTSYFFTVPNNEKIFSWRIPNWYYVLKVTPSDTFDYIQVVGDSEDLNKASSKLFVKWEEMNIEYERLLSDTDVIGGGNEQENPEDDVGQGEGMIGGIGAFSQDTPPPPKVEVSKVVVEEDIFIVKDNGTVIGSDVNMGGSPYAGL